jgi:hypothetical protein
MGVMQNNTKNSFFFFTHILTVLHDFLKLVVLK